MKRILPLGIGLVGAVCGVGAVLAGAYVVLEYTDLIGGQAVAVVEEAAVVPATDTLPEVVATINGEAITRQMIEAEIKISRLNVNEPLPVLSGEDLSRAQEEALNQLITRHIILQEAARHDFTLDDEFVAKRVDLLFGSYGQEALDAALAEVGANRDDATWWVREIFTVEGYTTEVIMGEVAPEARQQVYNDWMNLMRSRADIKTFLNGAPQSLQGSVGQSAPDFTLATTEGGQVSLADYRGKVVMINFWASWCPSCVAEMPDYEAIYQSQGRGQADFIVLGINLQESGPLVAEYVAGLGVTYPVLLDEDGQVTNHHYQATGMPASFIIDRKGNIFYRHLGPMSAETLTAKLTELGL